MRLAYCGHDFFVESLRALVRLGHEIDSVFIRADGNVLEHSRKIFQATQALGTRVIESAISERHLRELRGRGVEGLVVAAYPHRIPKWSDDLQFAVNVHSSLLPIGRGPFPLQQCLYEGHLDWGVSLHEVRDVFDAGAILSQVRFSVPSECSFDDLAKLCQEGGERLVSGVFANFYKYWNEREVAERLPYNSRPTMLVRTIDHRTSVMEGQRRLRAFASWGTYAIASGRPMVVFDGHFFQGWHGEGLRELMSNITLAYTDEIVVKLADGILVPTRFDWI